MSVTLEEEALAERVVQKSKREANVDTGRLMKSINQKIQRGVITFREYFYGQYNENSTLEKNAKEMMGQVPYKIERLDEDGNAVLEVNKATSGRVAVYERKKEVKKKQRADITALLIERRKRNAEKESDNNTSEDN